nr:unnamed protein product [Callosobruchus analis]
MERIKEYVEIEQEAELEKPGKTLPGKQ